LLIYPSHARRHHRRSRGGVRPVHAQLGTVLPTYADSFTALVNNLESWLATLGIGREQLKAALGEVSFGRIAGFFTSLLIGLAGAFSNLLLLLP
jgi:AI-2 transport protein TqsA